MTAFQTEERSDGAVPRAAVIGGGPAGLMAAEVMAKAGLKVDIFDAMPSVGRKFLLAGRGGLNLTHSEPLDRFITRYGERAPVVASWLERFSPEDMKAWAAELGIETFVGSSGRVFPVQMKATSNALRSAGLLTTAYYRDERRGCSPPIGR